MKAVGIGAEFESAFQNGGAGTGTKAAVEQGTRPIDNDFGWIEIVLGTEAVAFRACAVGRIEAEGARLELRNGKATIGAGELLGEGVLAAADDGDGDEALGKLQGGGDGLFQTRGDALLDQ